MTLKEEITYLVSLEQEGGYWDFKKQWYDNKTSLLHDIICMANNLHNRNAYIIIGIDEEHNFAVVDVKADPNRRNTQNMVTFLRDKKFAGGTRPFIHVEQISLLGKDVDVIVIENSSKTPFYLTDHFEGVRANHIYTRIMDTNTPIDKSADINNIEYLWRKRFHIDEMPIDQFKHFLRDPDDWETIQGVDMCSKVRFFCFAKSFDKTKSLGVKIWFYKQKSSGNNEFPELSLVEISGIEPLTS